MVLCTTLRDGAVAIVTTPLPPLPPKTGKEWTTEVWTAADLRARDRAILLWAAEQCAAIELENWHAYKRGHDHRRANTFYEGVSDGAGECSSILRAAAESIG